MARVCILASGRQENVADDCSPCVWIAATWELLFLCIKMSLVDLGKRLLEAARKGQDDEVRTLMANGAPFTTDWVSSTKGPVLSRASMPSQSPRLSRSGALLGSWVIPCRRALFHLTV